MFSLSKSVTKCSGKTTENGGFCECVRGESGGRQACVLLTLRVWEEEEYGKRETQLPWQRE